MNAGQLVAALLRRNRWYLLVCLGGDSGEHILLENGNILATEGGDHLVLE